jgi:hypothetical protein
MLEGRHVGTLRNVDPNRVLLTGAQVVAFQPPAQLGRFDADHRIGLPIERGGIAPEHVDRDGQALQPFGATGQGLLDEVREKATVARGSVEAGTGQDTFERLSRARGVHCSPLCSRPPHGSDAVHLIRNRMEVR